MNAKISGRFTYDDIVHIESNQFYSISQLMQIGLHELSHRKLSQSTYFGRIIHICNDTATDCLSKFKLNHHDLLSNISKHLSACSEITQESLAYYSQYYFIKIDETANFEDELSQLKQKYEYKSYKLSKVITLLEHPQWEEIFSSNVLFRIGCISMNVSLQSLSELEIMESSLLVEQLGANKRRYHPDFRFKLLLQALSELMNVHEVKDITDELLAGKAGIEYSPFELEGCLQVAKRLKDEYQNRGIPIGILESIRITNNDTEELDDEDIQTRFLELMDLMRPTSINDNYEVISDVPLAEFDIRKGIFSCIWILITGETQKVYMMMFDDVGQGKRYLFFVSKRQCESTMQKYGDLPICVYPEDYEEMLRTFPDLGHREIFIYQNSPYVHCKEFIEKHISDSREIMFHHLNDQMTAVFIRLKNNNKFVMLHTGFSIALIASDIKNKKYRYVNTEGVVDGVFWTHGREWWKYEDIIKSISQTYIFDRDGGTPGLGRRVNLSLPE